MEAPFEDVASETGLDFFYFNGMSGAYYFCELVGAGGALLDFDNDGDLDVFFAQGQMLGEGKSMSHALFPPPAGAPTGHRLFRNDLATNSEGILEMRFVDVTRQSGIKGTGYGMGAAVADFDNDGWQDLYITTLGPNYLYRNNGEGGFLDVTEAAGVTENRWSVSASFLDFDRDGFLDLYVGNYTDFTVESNVSCFATRRDYCNPLVYGAVPDRLFRNLGNGSFADVSSESGIDKVYGRSLGVIGSDLNGDGWQDIYVANDGTANQLWINQGNGTFRDEALIAGAGLNETGLPEAGMGVDAGDFDGDGDEDLFVTHFLGETNTLYRNDGSGMFEDRTNFAGLGPPSQPFTGFGTAWFDYDNDGWLDLLVANGAVSKIDSLEEAGDPFPFHQKNQLFRNEGNGVFADVSSSAGTVFQVSLVTRGALFGDLDNDGDTDVVLSNNGAPAALLRNRVGNRSSWIGLRLVEPGLKRDSIGARAAVAVGDGRVLWRRVHTDGSYASAGDPRILAGLGSGTQSADVRVIWPDGSVERWPDLPARSYHILKKGEGAAEGAR